MKLGSGVRGRMSKAGKKNSPQRTRRSRVGAYPYPFHLKGLLGNFSLPSPEAIPGQLAPQEIILKPDELEKKIAEYTKR